MYWTVIKRAFIDSFEGVGPILLVVGGVLFMFVSFLVVFALSIMLLNLVLPIGVSVALSIPVVMTYLIWLTRFFSLLEIHYDSLRKR